MKKLRQQQQTNELQAQDRVTAQTPLPQKNRLIAGNPAERERFDPWERKKANGPGWFDPWRSA